MKILKERYCSYELSKLLKEKGFDWKCNGYYFKNPFDGSIDVAVSPYAMNKNSDEYRKFDLPISAPTHQMAMDWLRNKGYHIEIQTLWDEFEPSLLKFTNFHALITTIIDGRVIDETHLANEEIKDYSECVENAIKYCLTKLMKGGEK